MKIYEILEAPDDIQPDINIDPTGSTTDRFGDKKDWSADEYAQIRMTYAKNPALMNLINAALLMPHIRTMQQAVDYANTELALRTGRKSGTDDSGDIRPDKKRIGTFSYSAGSSPGSTKPAGLDRSADVSYSGKFDGDGEYDALGAVADAGKKVAGMIGDMIPVEKGTLPGGQEYTVTATDKFKKYKADYFDEPLSKGAELKKAITGK